MPALTLRCVQVSFARGDLYTYPSGCINSDVKIMIKSLIYVLQWHHWTSSFKIEPGGEELERREQEDQISAAQSTFLLRARIPLLHTQICT